MDAIGLLAHMVELAEKKELTAAIVLATSKLAIKFLGNASVNSSQERRRQAIMKVNPKLVDQGVVTPICTVLRPATGVTICDH